jgi:hypothetical protein
MSIRAVRPRTPVRWAWTVCLLPLIVITGCSSGSSTPTSAAGSSGTAAASATPVRASAPGSTTSKSGAPLSKEEAALAARPNGVATCKMLTSHQAQQILGGSVGAGSKDRRKDDPGRKQLDGCAYIGTGGTRLAYLVWQTTSASGKTSVTSALPATQMGARRFNPKVGDLSAGAVVSAGPMTIAQVNAERKGRLVQVTVTGSSARAETAAIAAARSLIA